MSLSWLEYFISNLAVMAEFKESCLIEQYVRVVVVYMDLGIYIYGEI